MEILIIIALVVIVLVIYGVYSSSQKEKMLNEVKERRQKYVESIGPNARVIVNNGIHFFFKDDVQKIFGIDESGKTYDFENLTSISILKDAIHFYHMKTASLCVGKDVVHPEGTFPLTSTSLGLISSEMMPVLRNNLKRELDVHAIIPTYQYEHEGIIWGCDIESRMFYMTYGSIQIHPFSDLKRFTVEDMRSNSLYSGNYMMSLYIKSDFFPDDDVYELSFDSMDSTFNNLLSMFKEIRKRRY